MRIVQLADLYAPVIGGAERHTRHLAQELAGRGHDSVVVTIGTADLPRFETDDKGVRVYRIRSGLTSRMDSLFSDPERRYHPPVADLGITHGLARLLAGLQPDVVHGHNWMTYSYLAVRRRGDAAVVHTLHDYGAVCHKRTYLRPDGSTCDGPALPKCSRCGLEQYGAVKSAVLATGLQLSQHRLHPRVDRFIAVSNSVAEVSRAHLGGRPVEVVPTFVPDGLDVVGATTPRPDFLPAGDYILFVGALTRVKGLDTLISAHQRLGPSAPPLVLIGTPTSGAAGRPRAQRGAGAECAAPAGHVGVASLPLRRRSLTLAGPASAGRHGGDGLREGDRGLPGRRSPRPGGRSAVGPARRPRQQ